MNLKLQDAFAAGYERLSAWADLLDTINLFPVADRDTGRNLLISLAPLHRFDSRPEHTANKLLLGATGNSGNIAACFFAGLVEGKPAANMCRAVKIGRDRAWQSIADPKSGTMLTVFDVLLDHFENMSSIQGDEGYTTLIDRLENTVHSTAETLPRLKAAGVVDAGALGMFIFLEAFYGVLTDWPKDFRSITAAFNDKLRLPSDYTTVEEKGYCVDTLIEMAADSNSSLAGLAAYGESIIVHRDDENVKIHLHTEHRETVRKQLESLGKVVRWTEEDMGARSGNEPALGMPPALHIVTDAAGSVTRDDAAGLGMTLLDSYIVFDGGTSLPETLIAPEELYALMRKGVRVTTAQASVFERNQRYQSIISRFGSALYLCVGSVYTGNYQAVAAWKERNDSTDQLTVIDTGLASGRLGIVAIATARYSFQADSAQEVIAFAEDALRRSEEYIFLDRLQYLAAGGRLSKTKGFFGDFFGVKPIISPAAEGAVKAGTVRNRSEQVAFALEKLEQGLGQDVGSTIMLEYSDNRRWVEDTVLGEITRRYAAAEVVLQPLSLTSGAHMGPGTWAVAFLPCSKPQPVKK